MRIALALTALIALTACETMKGAGHDIQKGGAVISNEAAKTQAQM